MPKIKCLECGKPFVNPSGRGRQRKTCGDVCAYTRQLRLQGVWFASNKPRMAQLWVGWYAKNRARYLAKQIRSRKERKAATRQAAGTMPWGDL